MSFNRLLDYYLTYWSNIMMPYEFSWNLIVYYLIRHTGYTTCTRKQQVSRWVIFKENSREFFQVLLKSVVCLYCPYFARQLVPAARTNKRNSLLANTSLYYRYPHTHSGSLTGITFTDIRDRLYIIEIDV